MAVDNAPRFAFDISITDLLNAVSAISWHTALLALVSALPLAILLNVVWQLVRPKNPSLPPRVFHWIPWVGSAIAYGTDPMKFFSSCREKYGDVFTYKLFGVDMTAAMGIKGNHFVLGGDSKALSAAEAYTHLTTPIFGKDVCYDVAPDVWMEQKRWLKFGLSIDNFRAYVGMIEDEVESFMGHDTAFDVWRANDVEKWGQFDALEVFSEITILTASRTLQGKEVRAGLDKSFAQLYSDLDGGFTPLNFLFPNLPLESYRRRDRAHQKMSNFYVDIIKKRKAAQYDHEHDIIASLIGQSYRDGRTIPDHEIAHILIGLLMAGQHTSSTTSSWAMLHLAANPEVADAVYQEQVKHFSTPDGSLRAMTYEELKTLPVLDSVIRETLRIHPPIHSIMRKVLDDVAIPQSLASPSESGSYVVPKGHVVIASPAVSQIDPRVWPEPLKWWPERWTDPKGVAAQAFSQYHSGEKHDYGFGVVSKGTESPYQPFGAGRHRCIGEQFAYIQLGTIIATFIRKMEFRVKDGQVPDHDYTTMITLPKKPRTLFYRRRHAN